MTNIADLRKDYKLASLNESDVASSPLAQFDKWFKEALSAELPEPTAMTLATCDAQSRPSARMVLIKDFDERGFVFFTNYESHKGRTDRQQSRGAAVFWPS
jgi:pyridoxamine 5'-phosphate oxidase